MQSGINSAFWGDYFQLRIDNSIFWVKVILVSWVNVCLAWLPTFLHTFLYPVSWQFLTDWVPLLNVQGYYMFTIPLTAEAYAETRLRQPSVLLWSNFIVAWAITCCQISMLKSQVHAGLSISKEKKKKKKQEGEGRRFGAQGPFLFAFIPLTSCLTQPHPSYLSLSPSLASLTGGQAAI